MHSVCVVLQLSHPGSKLTLEPHTEGTGRVLEAVKGLPQQAVFAPVLPEMEGKVLKQGLAQVPVHICLHPHVLRIPMSCSSLVSLPLPLLST